MLEFIKTILKGHNEFASGGLLLMVIGGLGVYLRAVPEAIWNWVLLQTTMMITVKDEDESFVWVKEWFLEQPFLNKIRRVDLDTTTREKTVSLLPAPGKHWFFLLGRPFLVDFSRTAEATAGLYKRRESLSFRTIGRDQEILRKFVQQISDAHGKTIYKATSLFSFNEYWNRVKGYLPKRLESTILKGTEKEDIVHDIETFLKSKNRYEHLGIPYHRGYLLFGPPGTGKTSLVSGLSQKFGMSIYLMDLKIFNDKSLVNAINNIPQQSIILFEDIDCAGPVKLRSSELSTGADSLSELGGVTLSGLLNVLDGFRAPENVLFFMTTNHFEILDSALLRPGRVDYKLYMGEADEIQKLSLYKLFFPSSTEIEAIRFINENTAAKTMAEFQNCLLTGSKESTPLLAKRAGR